MRIKQREGSKCSAELGNAGKSEYGRELSPASCRLGIYRNGLLRLSSDLLPSSHELEATVTLTPSLGASPRIVSRPWGCLGTARAVARCMTDYSQTLSENPPLIPALSLQPLLLFLLSLFSFSSFSSQGAVRKGSPKALCYSRVRLGSEPACNGP